MTITKTIEDVDVETVLVPLNSVKFEIENGFVFTLDGNVLVQKPVILGVARGSSVEIIEGLDSDEKFVTDARGLLVGSEVEIVE